MSAIEEQGFEIFSDVIDHGILREVDNSLNEVTLRRSRAGLRNALRLEAVRHLARDETLMKLARQVLGANAFPFRATLFDKSPDSNWLVVWHQDIGLPLRERKEIPGWGAWFLKEGMICAHAPASALEQVLAVRVHLDDSNHENGPLKVLPSTHRVGVLSDDAIHDLVNSITAIECCVLTGGVLLMRPLLVHASSKVKPNGKTRRVLHVEYASCRSFAGGIELAACQ